jgi:ClpX C4-type zinc finger
MVIDEGLLRQAREAGARLADAQRQAELAKADYHHAVRRMHHAGASMREIADVLELSHQRVHQIIEATGGTGGWKARKKPKGGLLACSFCDLPKNAVAKLVAGPGIYICDSCVALAQQAIAEAGPVENLRTRLQLVSKESDLKCSFCGKAARMVGTLVAGPGPYICDGCLQICEEVIAAAT